VDCCITDYSTTHEEWSQEASKDGSEMKNNWTRDLPVEDGVYHVRVKETHYQSIVMVSGNKILRFGTERNGLMSDIRSSAEWQGPITPND